MKKIICVFLCFFSIIQSSVYAYSNGSNPLLKRLRGTDGQSVLILMYHKLSNSPSEISDFCISPENFEKDIDLLKRAGYVFCTASELVDLAKSNKSETKYVAITFDDGYESDYLLALPILEKYGAKATFFVFGGAIGKPDYMSEKQLYKLAQSNNVEIGNHSYQIHDKKFVDIKQLYATDKNDNLILNDFIKNKEFLESITNKEITTLSYPNGIYNNRIDSALRNHGIKITFSTEGRIEKLSFVNRVMGRFNRGKDTDISKYISK